MRSDRHRRLTLLEGGLGQQIHGQAETARLLGWFTDAHGHLCDWDVFERMDGVPYSERAGVICDYVEAIGAIDPAAAAEFYQRLDRS